jgi:transposase
VLLYQTLFKARGTIGNPVRASIPPGCFKGELETVRESSCRDCETITQPPAPFHVIPRGFAGPQLLAMILFEKFSGSTSR